MSTQDQSIQTQTSATQQPQTASSSAQVQMQSSQYPYPSNYGTMNRTANTAYYSDPSYYQQTTQQPQQSTMQDGSSATSVPAASGAQDTTYQTAGSSAQTQYLPGQTQQVVYPYPSSSYYYPQGQQAAAPYRYNYVPNYVYSSSGQQVQYGAGTGVGATNAAIQPTSTPAMSSTFSATASGIGQVQPAGLRPRITTTMWEDEKTLCYQVEANGVSVVRRADNNMINGTKLLNVAKMSRGRRDGILKAEKTRHVVKIGSMHLKGVWIPFDRALAMAQRENIVDMLYPLFVKDIKKVIQQGTAASSLPPATAQYQTNYASAPSVQQQPQQQPQQPPQQQQQQQQQPQQQSTSVSSGSVADSYQSQQTSGSVSQPQSTSSAASYGNYPAYYQPPNTNQQYYYNYSTAAPNGYPQSNATGTPATTASYGTYPQQYSSYQYYQQYPANATGGTGATTATNGSSTVQTNPK